jgi:hypothetical protein
MNLLDIYQALTLTWKFNIFLKAASKLTTKIKIEQENYSMDDRLLDLDRQDEADYPKGFIWGVKYATVYPGWTLKQDTDEIKVLEKTYGLKFYQVYFDTNAYDLIITFHDIDIEELKRIDKKKNAI